MSDDLDPLDKRILEALELDGRIPLAQIAQSIGLSRPAVSDRLEKLERTGILRGTTAVIDPLALGRAVTAFVSGRRSGTLDAAASRAFQRLKNRPEILEIHSVAGDDCYLIKVRTDSIASLNTLVSSLSAAPMLMTTRTTIVMETHCEKVGGIDLQRERRK